jgi:putative transposase
MPKNRRHVPPNSILHIVNRGNDKKVIFPESVDYGSFLALLREGRERYPIELFAYSLMPNHFHLVVRTEDLDAIAAYMHFLQRNHACDLRACYRSRGHGHIFQRRYWSKLVEGDAQLLMVMKYVEANPVRAGLVEWAHEWEWSSMWERVTGERDLLNAWPSWLPEDWPTVVTIPLLQFDLDWIRRPIERGRPRREDRLQNT